GRARRRVLVLAPRLRPATARRADGAARRRARWRDHGQRAAPVRARARGCRRWPDARGRGAGGLADRARRRAELDHRRDAPPPGRTGAHERPPRAGRDRALPTLLRGAPLRDLPERLAALAVEG